MIKIFKLEKFKSIILLTIGFTLFPAITFAAVLYLEPSQGQYYQGDTFTAQVRVDTEGEAINTVEADIVFSPDLLEVVGLEKENSILRLWIGDPVYLNDEGLISFVGGLPAPGYKGKDGLIGKIIFKVKSEGRAEVSFQENSSKVLINDGFGTKALLTTRGAAYDFVPIKKKLFSYLIILLLVIFFIAIIWRIRNKHQNHE